MSRGRQLLIFVIVGLVSGVLVTVQPASATHFGVAQYLAVRAGSGQTTSHKRILNPLAEEMFALEINYDSGGSFSSCDGTILGAKDSDAFNGGSNLTEIIAVSTSRPLADNHEIGVVASVKHRPVFLMLATQFKVASSSAASVTSCACTALSDNSQPGTLLTRFGITCP